MFGISLSEILLILVVAIFLIDADEIPHIMRKFAHYVKEFNKLKNEFFALFKEGEADKASDQDQLQQPKFKYILDQDGKLRKVYDLSILENLKIDNLLDADDINHDEDKTIH